MLLPAGGSAAVAALPPRLLTLPLLLPPLLPAAQRDGTRVLATPALDGKILPGITRDSIIQLARGWGECAVEERRVTVREVKEVGGWGGWAGLGVERG